MTQRKEKISREEIVHYATATRDIAVLTTLQEEREE